MRLKSSLEKAPLKATQVPEEGLLFAPGNQEAIHLTCQAIGQIIEGWGFKKIMGVIWAFLYLCPEPATTKDICTNLKISPALASITLQDLLRWGVVNKTTSIGKRLDYYTAEHDIWKMIRKVFREREKMAIEQTKNKLEEAIKSLNNELNTRMDIKSRRTSQFQKLRLEDLIKASQTAEQIMDGFINLGSMNIAPLFALLKPYTNVAKSLKQ
jgi:HTH-type transcriptional regulator, glycine betaine synthesis regulator